MCLKLGIRKPDEINANKRRMAKEINCFLEEEMREIIAMRSVPQIWLDLGGQCDEPGARTKYT